jgi:hypothetical protein
MGPVSMVQSWTSHLEIDEKLVKMCQKNVKNSLLFWTRIWKIKNAAVNIQELTN